MTIRPNSGVMYDHNVGCNHKKGRGRDRGLKKNKKGATATSLSFA